MEKDYPLPKKCKKNHHYCDRLQYGEIGWPQRFQLWLHLLFCASCRTYSQQNSRLTRCIKESDLHLLKPHETEAIKKRLFQKTPGTPQKRTTKK